MRSFVGFGAICLAAPLVQAISLDVNSTQTLTTAAQTVASRVLDLYSSNSTTIGLFGEPYYWWESGLAWDTLIRYWALTGDASNNAIVGESLMWQVGSKLEYMPVNQTKGEGNDDQAAWALAAMTAAEYGFPMPSGSDDNITWVQLAENVFNDQVGRWDDSSCGGGLSWQIFTFNNGYDYKNAMSNGNFVQLAARLGLYTGNATYTDWARKATQWSLDTGLIANTSTGNPGAVYDGFSTTTNCSALNHLQWTAGAGTYLSGAAYASNDSSTLFWNSAVFALLINANSTFAPNGTLIEVACEMNDNCSTDQLAFKGILIRGLAAVRDLTYDNNLTHGANATAPQSPAGSVHGLVNGILQTSAKGAATACSGGGSGTDCGSSWTSGSYDGSSGLGQELNALEVILANMPAKAIKNVNSTAAVSSGNGTSSSSGGGGSNNSSTGTSPASTSSSSAVPKTSTNEAAGRLLSTTGLLVSLAAAAAMFL
ncbi:hydrolase 76 protein [Recurvomyces mirabilis]|uniref:Mannan endo-1,6-alpha-mannosidase n=1 Tax=Recurvomyces mirabilis TaxID=574656 RepID=A0AAE0WW22_9PEZI|nr:hydrolase 76 protein [Recurvomyces mirabilis]KAK5161423.1 hydrolase 76 protein [Recurvomyces mirabilis]